MSTFEPGRSPNKILKARAREERRARVGDMVLTGRSLSYIASVIGVGLATVERDLKRLQDEWRTRQADGHDARVARQIARLDRIEAEAWGAWEQSKKPAERTVTRSVQKAGGDSLHSELVKTERVGDAAFIASLTRLQQLRMEIEGTKAPVRADVEVRLGVDDVFIGGDTLEAARVERDAFAADPRFKPRGIEDMRSTNGANGSAANGSTGNGSMVEDAELIEGGDDDEDDDDGSSNNGAGGNDTLQ